MNNGLKVRRIHEREKLVATIQLAGRTDEEINADIERLFAGQFEVEDTTDEDDTHD